MKKFLLSLSLAVGAFFPGFAQELKEVASMPLVVQDVWLKNSSYTATTTSLDKEWTAFGFNNNNLGWNGEFRCGRKGNASTANITKVNPIAEAVSQVILYVGSKVDKQPNSVKLYVADNKDFTGAQTYSFVGTFEKSTEYTLNLPTPQSDCYYKVEFDMASQSANGVFSIGNTYISALRFFASDEVAPKDVENVTITSELNEDYTATVTLNCETEGATISYGTSKDALTETYTGPFTVKESCTIYAQASKDGKTSSVTSKAIELPTVYHNLKDLTAITTSNVNVIAVGNFSVLYQNGQNVVVTDGKSNVLLYGTNNLTAGTKISKITGTSQIYSKMFELVSFEVTEGGEGAEYTAYEPASLSDVKIDENIFDQVKFTNASISGVNGKNATLTRGGETIKLYNTFGIEEFAEKDNVIVTGFVWRYNDNLQIAPISIETGTVVNPDVLGPITVNGKVVNEGDEITVFVGSTVTIKAENAEMLTIDALDGNGKTALDESLAADSYEWSGFGRDTYTFQVSSLLGEEDQTVFFTIIAKVDMPALGRTLVNGKEVSNEEVVDAYVNSTVTIEAENAECFEYTITPPVGEEVNDLVSGTTFSFVPDQIGQYLIMITAEGYNGEESDAMFTLNVTEKSEVTVETVTLDFVNNDYGQERSPSGYYPKPCEFTGTGNLKVTTYGGNNRLWTDGLRMYSGSVLAIEAPDKYMITNDYEFTSTGDTSFDHYITDDHTTLIFAYNGANGNKAIKTVTVTLAVNPARVTPSHDKIVVTPAGTGFDVTITHDFENVSIHYLHTPAEQAKVAGRRVIDHGNFSQASTADGVNHTFSVDGPGTVEYYGYHAASDTKGTVESFAIDADGNTTSIESIMLDGVDPSACYDLQGRRIARPTRGLYICNGKKLYVK